VALSLLTSHNICLSLHLTPHEAVFSGNDKTHTRKTALVKGTSALKAASSIKSVALTEYQKSLKENVSLFDQAMQKLYGGSLAVLQSRDHCLSRERVEAAIQPAPVALTSSSIQGPLWPCHFPSGLMESTASADTSRFDCWKYFRACLHGWPGW